MDIYIYTYFHSFIPICILDTRFETCKTFEEETNRNFTSRGNPGDAKKKKKKRKKSTHSIASFSRLEGTERNKKVTEKGVGDKGDVGRRDVRQAAPVGPPRASSASLVFHLPFLTLVSQSLPLSPCSIGFEERIFHLLRVSPPPSTFLSCLSAESERNASLRIKEERRLQTAPATPVNGDPHKPIVFPFPSLFAAGGDSNGGFPPRNPVDVVTVTQPCPSSSSPRHLSTLRNTGTTIIQRSPEA